MDVFFGVFFCIQRWGGGIDQPGTCLRQQFLPQAVRVVDSSTRNHKPSHTGINTELVYTNNTVPTQLVHRFTSSQRIMQDLLAEAYSISKIVQDLLAQV